jgi:hypothetical protein
MTGMKLDRMKSIGAALAGLALVAALVPEFVRHRAERHLYEASAIFRSLLAEGNAAAGETATLDAVATLAMRVAEGLAGDSRPLILAGSARLLERRPGEALAALPSCTRDRRARGCALLFSAADCPCQVSGARASRSPI